jgi:hypothetical protein
MRISVPQPSIADFFYLRGYMPIVVGILELLWAFRILVKGSRVLMGGVSGTLVGGVLISAFLPHTLFARSTDALTRALDLAYPILDVLILILWIHVGLVLNIAVDMLACLKIEFCC